MPVAPTPKESSILRLGGLITSYPVPEAVTSILSICP